MPVISTIPHSGTRWLLRGIVALVTVYLVGVLALMWWWSYEPAQFEVVKFAQDRAAQHDLSPHAPVIALQEELRT